MTRKDYIALASAFRRCRAKAQHTYIKAAFEIAELEVACALQADNPRFNTNHFLAVVRGERDLYSRPPRQTSSK